jgi:hypothetical protein
MILETERGAELTNAVAHYANPNLAVGNRCPRFIGNRFGLRFLKSLNGGGFGGQRRTSDPNRRSSDTRGLEKGPAGEGHLGLLG